MADRSTDERANREFRRRRQRGTQPSSRLQRSADVPAGHLAVGRIAGVHGLRGELRVETHTDFPEERFALGQSLLLGDSLEAIEVVAARPHKGQMLVRFENIETRDDAEPLQGTWLYIPEETAADLEEDTYFVHQIVGLTVQTTEGKKLGTIKDVLFTGANEVYVVQPNDGINQGRELLVPAIADVVQSVDLEAGVLTVQLLPGLMEE